mgnify:CR=1 FL=1
MSFAFNWNNPYPTIRMPVMGRNIVSTSHPYAAQAGLKIIQQGGNAIDAAIAAQWGPIQHAGKLHDRASYRYFWTLLQKAYAADPQHIPAKVKNLLQSA